MSFSIKKLSLKIFVSLAIVLTMFLPFVVNAQNTKPSVPATTSDPKTKPTDPVKVDKPTNTSDTEVDTWGCDGLQAQIEANGGGRAGELPKYCSEGEVYKKIVYWLYYILGLGAVISLIYGGYMYMTARENETQTKKGKNIIMYTIAGIAIAIIATTIVTIVVNLVVDNQIF